MAYTQKINSIQPLGTPAKDSLVATGVHSFSYHVQSKILISRFLLSIVTLVACNTIAPVVKLKRRPTPGSSSGEVVIASMTVPDALAVGECLYKDVEPVAVYPGEEVVFEVTTAGTDSGSAAGEGVYGFEGEEAAEQAANISSMVESA